MGSEFPLSSFPFVYLKKLLYIGAESFVYLAKFESVEAIVKLRRRKTYINETLWQHLSRSRLKREAKMLINLKSIGIPSPKLYYLDLEKSYLVMEYIDAPTLYEKCEEQLYSLAGKLLARLHNHRIWHGDYNPKNLIYKNTSLYLIDPALSKPSAKNEEMAYDIFTMVKSTLDEGLARAFIDSYKEEKPEIYSAYLRISSLGRYK